MEHRQDDSAAFLTLWWLSLGPALAATATIGMVAPGLDLSNVAAVVAGLQLLVVAGLVAAR